MVAEEVAGQSCLSVLDVTVYRIGAQGQSMPQVNSSSDFRSVTLKALRPQSSRSH